MNSARDRERDGGACSVECTAPVTAARVRPGTGVATRHRASAVRRPPPAATGTARSTGVRALTSVAARVERRKFTFNLLVPSFDAD